MAERIVVAPNGLRIVGTLETTRICRYISNAGIGPSNHMSFSYANIHARPIDKSPQPSWSPNGRGRLFVDENMGIWPESDLRMAEATEVQRESARVQELAMHPLSFLELPARAENVFAREKIKTVGDLISTRESDLLSFIGISTKTINEVRKILAEHKLRFGMSVPQEEKADA